jgi:hypothetical protein
LVCTIRVWMPRVRAKRFRRIEVVVPRGDGVVVHGPHGVRIEGLDLDSVAELLGHAFGLDHEPGGLMDAHGYGGGAVDAETLRRFCENYRCN